METRFVRGDSVEGLLSEGVAVCAPDHDNTKGVFLQHVMGGIRCHVAWLHPRRSEIGDVTRPRPCDLLLDLERESAQVAVVRAMSALGHNLRWMLPAPLGDSRAEWTAGLLACSVGRVARGLGPVVGVLGRWKIDRENEHSCRRYMLGAWPSFPRDAHGTNAWVGVLDGDERHAEDLRFFAAGFALVGDDGGLVLPWVGE